MATTTRGAFPFPDPADNRKQIRAQVKALADQVAAVAVLYTQADPRPAAGVQGRIHRHPTTGVLSYDTGSAWDDVAVSRVGGSTITASGSGVKGLVVKAAAGQTANLQEWQASSGAVAASISATGGLAAPTVHGRDVVRAGSGAAGVGAYVEVVGLLPVAKGLVVRGAPSQAANLAEFQNDSGTVLSAVRPSGAVNIGATASALAGALGLGLTDTTSASVGSFTGGGTLFADAGRLFWRGSSGTLTQIAAS